LILVVSGSRSITKYAEFELGIARSGFMLAKGGITELVHGACPDGVDQLAEKWALQNDVPIKQFPADWSEGKKAGPLRNQSMIDYAKNKTKWPGMLILWDGYSNGAFDTLKRGKDANFLIYVHMLDAESSFKLRMRQK